jgi:hypothetical protein
MERSSLVTAAQPYGIYTRFPISPYTLARALCRVFHYRNSGSEKERKHDLVRVIAPGVKVPVLLFVNQHQIFDGM